MMVHRIMLSLDFLLPWRYFKTIKADYNFDNNQCPQKEGECLGLLGANGAGKVPTNAKFSIFGMKLIFFFRQLSLSCYAD
jgi:hypothetical protein